MLQSQVSFSPDNTRTGQLPPLEVVTAYAFREVTTAMERQMAEPAHVLLGQAMDQFVAARLHLKCGGHPTKGAMNKAIRRCKDADLFLGKPPEYKGGRTASVPLSQKLQLAEVAMSVKRKLVRPTSAAVRGATKKAAINQETGERISDYTL